MKDEKKKSNLRVSCGPAVIQVPSTPAWMFARLAASSLYMEQRAMNQNTINSR